MKEGTKIFLNKVTEAGFMICGIVPDQSANMARVVVNEIDDLGIRLREKMDRNEGCKSGTINDDKKEE